MRYAAGQGMGMHCIGTHNGLIFSFQLFIALSSPHYRKNARALS